MASFDLVGQVRDSYAAETGEPISRAVAEVYVDRMCDAFFHKVQGAGVRAAVYGAPDVALYLAYRWTGDDGRALRAVLKDEGLL